MMKPKVLSINSGFTLVEVLVAMMVMGIGIIGLMALQAACIKARVNSQHTTYAKELASSKLDELVAERAETSGTESRSSRGVNYTITWATNPYQEDSRLSVITVTAQWNEKDTSKKVVLSTMLY